MLKVGEVSHKLGLNSQTLYFYERIGLIPPPQRTESGYRLFSEQDINRLSFITRAKALGLSLGAIKEILMLRDGQLSTCQVVHDHLVNQVKQLEENIRQMQAFRDELLTLVHHCRTNLDCPDPLTECVVLERLPHES